MNIDKNEVLRIVGRWLSINVGYTTAPEVVMLNDGSVTTDLSSSEIAEPNNDGVTTDLSLVDPSRTYVYRLRERGSVRTYEIGYIKQPTSSNLNNWCDNRVCEGFWGDEEMVKKVVSLLNGC